jgi:hypothetical protein
LKKQGFNSSKYQLLSVVFIFCLLFVGTCTNNNWFTSSDGIVINSSSEEFKQAVTINAAEFGNIKSAELIDAIIFFEENINVQLDGIIATYDYSNLNGIFASITPELYHYLESAWFVSSISEDGIIEICQDTLDWGVDAIDAEKVWGNAEDAKDINPGNFTGAGIKVAVLDTGVDYTHPDLDDNYVGGYDFENSDANPIDDHGHGTHCSGIIAAEDNDDGVIGVAPEASLYAVKVIDSAGYGDISNAIAGIDWCIANDIDVISMSLGWPSGTTAFEDACIRARDAGIVMCVSSGNENSSPKYPSIYASTICVGAIDSDFLRASFSNYGPQLDVVAPGVAVYSTMPTYFVTMNDFPYYFSQDYDYCDGTSMACPMVAGVAALLFDQNASYNPTEVRTIMQDTATDLGSVGFDNYYGYGAVNAYAAITGEIIEDPEPEPEELTLPLIEDGTMHNWYPTHSPYNAVTKTVFDGRTCIKNQEVISHLDHEMYAITDVINLSNWDGVSNITAHFKFRCTSNYASSVVTHFRFGFIDTFNDIRLGVYSVSQENRKGQTWISGYDSGWQEETIVLNTTKFSPYAGTDYLVVYFGCNDGWSAYWEQTQYLDYLTINISEAKIRDFNWTQGEGTMDLEWRAPLDWNVNEYHIEKIVDENWENLTSISHTGDNETLQTYHDNSGPLFGEPFHYRICAENQIGENSSWTYLEDSDGDRLIDELEEFYGTNKYNNDTDGDLLSDYDEIFTYNTNPLNIDSDGDGLIDWLEIFIYFTDPNNSDSDADLIPDGFEIIYGLDPNNATDASDDPDQDGLTNLGEHLAGTDLFDEDTDDDLLNDGDEVLVYFTDPHDQDSDDDDLMDGEEIAIGTYPLDDDSDDDNLTDGAEVNIYETNPLEPDTDTDGLDDDEEVFAGIDGYITDPNDPDCDDDWLLDGEEYLEGTNPFDFDTDDDGVLDGNEVHDIHTDPLDEDSDDDLLLDGEEVSLGDDGYYTDPLDDDSDDDGLTDSEEYYWGSNPNVGDSDGDGLRDGIEVNSYSTNPTNPDTDQDGLDDWEEIYPGTDGFETDPLDPDSDDDLIPDGWESVNGFDPLNGTDYLLDPDIDQLNNLQEYTNGTNPNNADSDGDTFTDYEEIVAGTDPLNPLDFPTPTEVNGFRYSILVTLGVLAFMPLLFRIKRKRA